MDDVAVWNEAFGPTRIEALAGTNAGGYAARVAPTSGTATVALWNFEELPLGGTVDTQRVEDTSGYGRDAFAGGGSTTPLVVSGSDFYGRRALRFDGDTDVVIFRDGFGGFTDGPPPAGTDINFEQDDSFTLEAAIRPASNPGGDGAGNIVGKDVGSNSPSWWFRILSDRRLQAIVDDNDPGNQSGLVTGSTNLTPDEWHHVAFVRDAANDEVRIYLDYALDGTAPDNTVNTSFNTNDIRIGAFNNASRQFIGDIDFVRVSLGALDPSQFVRQVPEPSALALAALGPAGMALLLRRRRRA
jgi:hypothetical protein